MNTSTHTSKDPKDDKSKNSSKTPLKNSTSSQDNASRDSSNDWKGSKDTVRADKYDLESHDTHRSPKLGFGVDEGRTFIESDLNLTNLTQEQKNEVLFMLKEHPLSQSEVSALNLKYPGIYVHGGAYPSRKGQTSFTNESIAADRERGRSPSGQPNNLSQGPMYLRDTWDEFSAGKVTDEHRNLVRVHAKMIGLSENVYDSLIARDPYNIQLLAQLI